MIYAILWMILNLICFLLYTRGKLIGESESVRHEATRKGITFNWTTLLFSIFQAFWCRERTKILMGSFSIPDIAVFITAYKNTKTGLFSVGSNKRTHHGLTVNEAMNRVNRLYDNNPPLRLKMIRLLQLLHYYNPDYFQDNVLKEEVLNSSFPIITKLVDGHVQTNLMSKWPDRDSMGPGVSSRDIPKIPKVNVDPDPDTIT